MENNVNQQKGVCELNGGIINVFLRGNKSRRLSDATGNFLK